MADPVAPLPQIVQARAELWRYPLPGATGGSGITAVDVIVVDLETADGQTGTGFSYVLGGGGETVCAMAADMLARFVAGRAAQAPQALWRQLAGSLNRLGRGAGYLAIAAIDVAAWDIWARTQGLPLGVAMGGAARALPVYGSGGFGPAQDPDAAIARAQTYAAMGCSAVKLRFAGNAADIERLRAVREALPDSVGIMGDLNEKADLVAARRLAGAAAEYGLLWLEEPLPAQDAPGYAALAAASPVPIATGEHLQGAVEFMPFFQAQACALAQPDLAMTGGLTEALRVAALAEQFGVTTAPHFLPALFVHVAAAAPSLRWLEDFPLLEPLFDGLPDIAPDGTMTMPDLPGHGMRWADGARAEFRVT
jgi:L-alanine-DL-glutamate epimerase-like enolase superfamily enzyme